MSRIITNRVYFVGGKIKDDAIRRSVKQYVARHRLFAHDFEDGQKLYAPKTFTAAEDQTVGAVFMRLC